MNQDKDGIQTVESYEQNLAAIVQIRTEKGVDDACDAFGFLATDAIARLKALTKENDEMRLMLNTNVAVQLTGQDKYEFGRRYMQDSVLQFMQAMHQHIPSKPSLNDYPFELRVRLIIEEALEFCSAAGLSPLDSDGFIITMPTKFQRLGTMASWAEMIDALCDLLYVVYGAAVSMGIDLCPFFEEVHRTNLSKLGPDGHPIYRDDGKVMKAPGWQPPRIKQMLDMLLQMSEKREDTPNGN